MSFLNLSHLTIQRHVIGSAGVDLVAKFRPHWIRENKSPCECIGIKEFTAGNTNYIFGFYEKNCNDSVQDMVLMKIFGEGSEALIDRAAEIDSFLRLHAKNLSSRLYGRFANGLVYEFVNGCTLTEETVRDPHISYLIAEHMAEWHANIEPTEKDDVDYPMLYKKLDTWVELCKRLPEFTLKHLHSPQQICYEVLKNELEWMQSKFNIKTMRSPQVFCHNDVLMENIIFNEATDQVKFIDLEYGGFNFSAFDIGNHFDEMCGLDVLDFSRYPGEEEQKLFIKHYLNKFNKLKQLNTPTECEIHQLYLEANRMALCAHFFWGVWACQQTLLSTMGFDYMGYANLKLSEYFNVKPITP